MKKKFLKCICIVILLIIIVFVLNTTRKIIILSKLDKSVSNLEDTKDNIYIKINSNVDDSNQVETEVFIKGDIEKSVITLKDNVKKMQIVYPTERKVFIEADGEKTLNIYKETAPKRTTDINASPNTHTVIVNYANSYNIIERIIMALTTKIKSANMDNKDCYELSGMHSPIFLYHENSLGMFVYLEKDTGLPIKLIEKVEEDGEIKEYVTEYEYKFDSVTDEDLVEPDVSEYKIVENN